MDNKRKVFTATFIRRVRVQKSRSSIPKVLLSTVKDDTGLLISNELWVNDTKGFRDLKGIKYGDIIQFTATLEETKTPKGIRREFSRLSNINILNNKENSSKSSLNSFNDDINAILDSLSNKNI